MCQHRGEWYLVRVSNHAFTPLLPTKKLKLPGSIMHANALAALALGEVVGLPIAAMLDALRSFRGLPHRCVWVANKQGIDWFNDSKGTNVGATVAAICGFSKPGQIILIVGGDGKGADFTPLRGVVAQHCRACVLIRRDARLVANVLVKVVPVHYAQTLFDAVAQVVVLLKKRGDVVLCCCHQRVRVLICLEIMNTMDRFLKKLYNFCLLINQQQICIISDRQTTNRLF